MEQVESARLTLLSWFVDLRWLPDEEAVRVGDERFATVVLNGVVYEGSAVCEQITHGSDGSMWANFRLRAEHCAAFAAPRAQWEREE